ncbi:RluA family pseudouridine synthase [Pelagicoccus sp. NFK12]|uniref:Pseudouridine synthase n=1 Tax=Pelagicoccus enzymogenes TaxID=2773457 RepID=A0A927IGM2_9BACT|nr:RluA family pseudouridine synthase [Pelagicoccus enzymogenes]MBD5779311.1 RluA family pseudouridine synthase [Pelagicoccus enzymogenes]
MADWGNAGLDRGGDRHQISAIEKKADNSKPEGQPDRFISQDLHGARLDKTVKQHFQLPWGKARAWIDTGKVFIDGNCVADQSFPVTAGTRIELRMSQPKQRAEPKLDPRLVVHYDEDLIVLNKPSGMMTVPHPESPEEETLDRLALDFLRAKDPKAASNRASLGVVHRIDKDTSGLVVFARTHVALKALSEQFRSHSIERRYLAIVHGRPKAQTIETRIARDAGDGLRGSVAEGAKNKKGDELGRRAVTHLHLVQSVGDASLVACRIDTGRTHQIRIHLSEIGHPIVGEKVYVRGFEGALISARRTMLHAERLGFIHPRSGEQVVWVEPPTPDFLKLLGALSLKLS